MSPSPTRASEVSWSTTAPTYATNVGRTSSLSAARLVQLAHDLSPMTSSSRVLDNGAGTGAVTFAVAAQFPHVPILATDISPQMLKNISTVQLPQLTTSVLDARALTKELDPRTFTHVFNAFMLQTITNPSAALKEMHEVLIPDGVIAIALWAPRNGPFEIWERACQSLVPTYTLPAPFDDPNAWRTQEELHAALHERGFTDIVTVEVTMPFPFESSEKFRDFWFGAKNPAAAKCMSNWNGDWDQVRTAVKRVCREEFADGKDVCTWATLGVGRKKGE